MVDRDTMEMARDAKRTRDENGVVDERADLVLALYELDIRPEPFTPTEQLRAMVADPTLAPVDPLAEAKAQLGSDQRIDDGVTRRPQAGAPASNQFGTFQVHPASPKQIGFIKRLLRERELGDVKIPDDLDKLNKQAASDLIDRLTSLPVKAGAEASAPRATDKQMAFLLNLIDQRDYYSLLPADRAKVDWIKAHPDSRPSGKGASELIEVLKATAYADRPQAPAGPSAPALDDGIYLKDGEVFKVYHTVHGANQQVAKQLIVPDGWLDMTPEQRKQHKRLEWDYTGKRGLRGLTADHRMDLAKAQEFGAVYGVCANCGATLTAEKSIERALGPVCAGKFR